MFDQNIVTKLKSNFKHYTHTILIVELCKHCGFIDSCDSVVRRIVWYYIFELVGVKQNPAIICSEPLLPIVHTWISSSTLNPTAIEVLYVAVGLTFDRHYDLFKKKLQTTTTNNSTTTATTVNRSKTNVTNTTSSSTTSSTIPKS